MEDYQETTGGYFLLEYLLCMFAWMILYQILLFRCLDGRTLADSRVILWGMVVGCNAWGIRCQWESHRRLRDILATQAIAFGLYTITAYFPLRPVLVQGVLAVTAVLAILYVVLIQSQPIRTNSPARAHRVHRFRRGQSVAAVVHTLAIGLGVLQAVLFVFLMLQGSVLAARVSATSGYEVGTGVSEAQVRTLQQLQPQTWSCLTARERLDVLQTVANIEGASLGLPHELNVAAEDMEEEEGLCAYYRDNTHQIMVNMDKLLHSNSGFLVGLICHESCHAYQHRLTELYAAVPAESRTLQLLQPAEQYAWEFRHYADGSEDYDSYYEQACESDARSYAKGRVSYYETLTGHFLDQSDSGIDVG